MYQVEEWRLIYHNRYSVSSGGQVKSLVTNKVLKPGKSSSGYLTVSLYDGKKLSKAKTFLVHKLVAEAFLGPAEGRHVNHKHGNITDNRLTELEYLSCGDNNRHARDVLGVNLGEKNPNCKIPSSAVPLIRESKEPSKVLAERYGVSAWMINAIKRGEYRSKG